MELTLGSTEEIQCLMPVKCSVLVSSSKAGDRCYSVIGSGKDRVIIPFALRAMYRSGVGARFQEAELSVGLAKPLPSADLSLLISSVSSLLCWKISHCRLLGCLGRCWCESTLLGLGSGHTCPRDGDRLLKEQNPDHQAPATSPGPFLSACSVLPHGLYPAIRISTSLHGP